MVLIRRVNLSYHLNLDTDRVMSKKKAPKTKPDNKKSEIDSHEVRHDDHHGEPFSLAASSKNTDVANKDAFEAKPAGAANNKFIKFEVFDNFLKSDMVDDVKTGMNNCVNATSCSISNAVDASNATSGMIEEVLSKLSKTVSEATQQNMKLGNEFLKCKDARDMISFQKKMFESNFNNLVNFYLDVTYAMQNFGLKHVDISANYLDKNIKCFHSPK